MLQLMRPSTSRLAAGIAVLLFAAALPAEAAQMTAERQAIVRTMAEELLAGLNPPPEAPAEQPIADKTLRERLAESAWQLKQWLREEKPAEPEKRKVAIWPFWKDDSAVPEDFAEMLSDSLLAELVRGKAATDEYVARDGLEVVMREIDEFNDVKRYSEKAGALLREAGADILIIGEAKPDPGGKAVYVRYRAIGVADGAIPASTGWYRFDYDFDATPTLSVAAALKRAAAHFHERLGAISTIRPRGIRFADSGIQTPFGRWFQARLVAELQRRARAAGGAVSVAEAAVPEKKFGMRGLKLARKSAEQEMLTQAGGDYVLSGRYWLLGGTVDLQLEMTGADGRAETWQGDIRTGSIGLALEPPKTLEKERETDNLGPITLFLSSDRGANPVYRLGQKVTLFVEASRDSYLYCFYRQADGKVLRVFPNRHHLDPRIAGSTHRMIPGAEMDFEWIVQPPTGVELMKCYAFDRDVSAELPRLVRKLDFVPLPYRSLDALTADLRAIRNVGIAENSMVVNVEE